MVSRIALAISFVCASSALADMVQPDARVCEEPNSSDTTCTYNTPSFFWPASYRNAATSFSWSGSQRDTMLLALDAGSPIFNSKGTFVGTLTADITELPAVQDADHRQVSDLVYNLNTAGTTYRIDQPVDFVFRMGSDEPKSGTHALDLSSADSSSLVVYPKLDRPWVKEVPEQTAWSELLSISLGGAIIVGLAALCDRRTLP